MGRSKKNTDAGQIEGPQYGTTGYGVTISEEGQPDIEGNFITDADLSEYQDYKSKRESHVFVSKDAYDKMFDAQTELISLKSSGALLTNDEAVHYGKLKEKEANEQTDADKKKAAEEKKKQDEQETYKLRLGPNPVNATNLDGRKTVFTRVAWDNTPWIMKDGQQIRIKSGGWYQEVETPEEVLKLQQ